MLLVIRDIAVATELACRMGFGHLLVPGDGGQGDGKLVPPGVGLPSAALSQPGDVGRGARELEFQFSTIRFAG